MDAKVKELIGIAASVAAGCDSCLEAHVEAARKEGADSREIQTAVQIARAVRLQAVAKIDDLASKLERGEPIKLVAVGGEGSGCGCGEGCNC
jgi:AhpD family alkylhydroperoxidase